MSVPTLRRPRGGGAGAAADGGWRTAPALDHTLLLGAALLLLGVGVVMVFSSSSVEGIARYDDPAYFSVRQAVGLALGLPLLLLAPRVPLVVWRRVAPLMLLGCLLLLVAVLFTGRTVDGAARWIALPGGFQLQPSEPAKLALVLWGADLLVTKRRLLHRPLHLLVPLVPGVGLVVVLVMLQPDLGTSIVLALVAVALLWHVGAPLWVFGVVATVVVAGTTWLAFAAEYRRARITGFLDPFADPLGTGYQSVQGLYALSSGGWFGLGLGASREKWADLLPNAHTDFIFAIVGEELGLLGAATVVGLFAVLAWAGLRVARRATDPFARLVAATLTTVLVGQAALNMATVVGLAPITGIPLPFLSYGNTALLTGCLSVGVLLACARTEPGAQQALARRRAARVAAVRAALPAGLPGGRRTSR